MILLGRIYIKYIKFCVKYCIRNIINTKFQFQFPYIRLWQGTIYKESSSILVILRQLFTYAHFRTIEWRHKSNRCTLLPRPPITPLERTYFIHSKRHNLQFFHLQGCLLLQLLHFSELLYRHLFKRRQFTKMIWLNVFFISLHGSNVKSGKKWDMKKYFLFYVAFHAVEIK